MDPYEALHGYLSKLPHGSASHPGCRVRAAGYEVIRKEIPAIEPGRVPTGLLEYLVHGSDDLWIPEVYASCLLEFWFYSACKEQGDVFRRWIRETNEQVLTSPLLRPVTYVLSPRLLLMGVTRSWGIYRKGSTAAATFSGRGSSRQTTQITLAHPPWLFSERQLEAFEEVFAVGARAAGAGAPYIRLASAGECESVYKGEWMPKA